MKVLAFARFEHAARTCWRDRFGRNDAIRTRDLLDGLAAKCNVPPDVLAETHAVRSHRNDLMHLDRRHPDRTLRAMVRSLRRFLSHLPDVWDPQ